MRQLMLDELYQQDIDKVKDYLADRADLSAFGDLFWVDLPGELLTGDQAGQPKDHPFRFAVELGETWVKFELLVRSRENMRSPHNGYADRRQLDFILDFADRMIEELGLMT